ncbi:hypothetical protein [Streptomyces sp. NPDC003036]|uniref:hypothetical protein n=1 Tax=Streptomyces sp. NPDC003036 TaxID=3154442 RepID=UPI0033B24701
MLHRGIKFVHAAVLAVSAVMAFLFVRGLDEELVLGNSAQVWVFDSDDAVSGADIARAIASFSDDHGVTVARELPDLKNPDRLRHLYLAPGGPGSEAASWLDEGYPRFGRQVETDVHPIAEVGQRDPRGYYYVFGPPEAAGALADELSELGLRVSVQHPLAPANLPLLFSGGDLFGSFWVVALAAVTMTGASVLLGARAYGVLRLQGKSFMDLLLRDLRQVALFWSVAAGVVAAAALAFLHLYNGLAWLGLFAAVTACLAGLLVLFVLAAHAAALALTFRVDVLRALKGRLPARAAFVGTYLVRVPALLLALGVAMDVALAGQHVLARQESQDTYARAGDAVTLRLNGSLVGEEKRMITQVGGWLRRADAAGQVIVAGRRDLQSVSSDAPLPQGEILVVNDAFLAAQPVLDPKGHRYAPAEPRPTAQATHPQAAEPCTTARPAACAVRLIVPESLSAHAPALSAAVPGVFGRLDPDLRRRLTVETLPAKSGQRLFGYNSGRLSPNTAHTPDDDRSLVRDPVLVVVPNGSKILTDDTYTAFATQDGIVFPDPDDALNALAVDKDDLHTYVTAVRPVRHSAALALREAVNDFRLRLFNLVAAVAVLLITGVGVCVIHARKHAQAIFAQHISGWRFTRIHRQVLAVEALLAVFLAAWVPLQVWQQNQDLAEFTSQGIPAPFPPVRITALDTGVIAGLVTAEVCAVLLALAVFHRRVVKEGVAGT